MNCTGKRCVMQHDKVDPATCLAVSYCPEATMITDDRCEIVCSETDYVCHDGTCEQHVLKWLKESARMDGEICAF